ncbi:hypothetical protein CR513_33385, partial [Mucuna pruriens]
MEPSLNLPTLVLFFAPWKRCNSMVVSWLQHSASESIFSHVKSKMMMDPLPTINKVFSLVL